MTDIKEDGFNTFLNLVRGHKITSAILAAIDIKLFTTIGNNKFSAKNLAEKLRTDLHATEVFLNFLTGFNLLKKVDGLYSNIFKDEEYISECSDYSIYPLIEYERMLKDFVISPKNIVHRLKKGDMVSLDVFFNTGFS